MTLTPAERLHACINNDPALDRPPVALWRHFPVDDQNPGTLAGATVDFQHHYNFDLVKVTPASSFALKDWGANDAWEGSTEGTRRYTHHVIHEPQDWERLPVLDPTKSAHLSDQLDCLKMIRNALGPHVPVIQTIFSPLAQAKNLAGGELLIAHLRKYPEAVVKGLQTIATTTRSFLETALQTGIDGIFYAVQHAQANLMTLDEYKTFGVTFDLDLLKTASGLWCNLLHLHGRDIYFELAAQYSPYFQIVNWHDRETAPSLSAARTKDYSISNGNSLVFCGGISQNTIVYDNAVKVVEEASDALRQTGGRRFMLGTGCVVPVIAPHGNIMAARQSVEKTQ